ncbi:MAG: ComEC/Rec2 family competence protein [Rikenellaceae bacterium]|nr:ComEC/Rec2 family competence protein [Rikenellaceae bacterium]
MRRPEEIAARLRGGRAAGRGWAGGPAPMFRVALPLAAGIALGARFETDWVPLAVTAGVAAWIAVRRAGRVGNLAFLLFAVCVGGLLATLHRTGNGMPAGRKLRVELELEAGSSVAGGSGRWNDYVARTRRWSVAEDVPAAAADTGGRWFAAVQKVVFRADTAWRLAPGERLLVGPVYVNPMADTTRYGRLMRARGYAAAIYLPAWSRVERSGGPVRSAAARLSRFHEAASARLRSLPLSPEAAGVCAAMGAGDRRWIPDELRSAYNRAGAAHLLAVSGLHVGIVFLLVNLLLYPLSLLRRGHVVKNLLVVAAVWGYALAAGLSPSAVRAACMFSMFQLSLAASVGYYGFNALCGAAALMLAFDPYALFDISFQLSFVAVAALLVWYRPVASWFRTRSRAVNLLCGTTVVGLVASVATAPLVACAFGRVPLLGVALNVPLAVSAHVVVLVSALWMLFPWPPLAALAGPLLEWSVSVQNRLVESCASVGWASPEVRLPAEWTVVIYGVLVVATAAVGRRNPDGDFRSGE